MKTIKEISVLDAEQEAALMKAAKAGDQDAVNAIVEHNLRLVADIARKYSVLYGIPLLDIVQEGNIGLFKAIEKFNPELGTTIRPTWTKLKPWGSLLGSRVWWPRGEAPPPGEWGKLEVLSPTS